MTRPSSLHLSLLVVALATLVTLTGCEEDVVAITGIDQPYSIYGLLTPQADTQRVAVYEIQDVLAPVEPTSLNATIRSTDLTTGSSQTWTEQLIQDSLGQYSHVYSSGFVPEYDHRYRVEVESPDGETTFAEVTVPPLVEVILPEPAPVVPRLFPIVIEGEAPLLLKILILYRVRYLDINGVPSEEIFPVSYDGEQRRTPTGWAITLTVNQDMRLLSNRLVSAGTIAPATTVSPSELQVNMIIASEDWDPPGGTFDFDVLAEPSVFTNVDNGFGYVVSGYRVQEEWAVQLTAKN